MTAAATFGRVVRLMPLLFCLLGFIPITAAFPKETIGAKSSYLADGWTPKPTNAPLTGLSRRQNDAALCGYVTGDLANPISCGPGFTCTSSGSLLGCCDVKNCALPTACYDFQAASACTGNCSSSAHFCTESSAPYCNTYTFTDQKTYTDFFCLDRGVGVQKASKIGEQKGLSMTAKIAIGVGVAVAGTAATAVMLFMPFPCLGGRSIKNIIQNHVQSWGGHASANSGAKNATDIDATAMSDPALGDTAEVTGPGANARSGNANARGGNANARGGDANTGPSPE